MRTTASNSTAVTDPLDPKVRDAARKLLGGNCYATSEALYHLLGGKDAGWTPMQMKHEKVSHWFLRHSSGLVLDVTAQQFDTPPDHSTARGREFMTKEPSERARDLMHQLLWSRP